MTLRRRRRCRRRALPPCRRMIPEDVPVGADEHDLEDWMAAIGAEKED